jgi:branched-chain amino acid transport system permease protein
MSLDILLGYAGLPSLGHASFFGFSAYVVALLNVRMFQQGGLGEFGIVLLAALCGATIIAAIFGLLVLHTRGIYFLMLTMALSMLLWGVAYKWYDVTGGSDGIRGISRPNISFTLWDITTNSGYFYFVLFFFALSSVLMQLIMSSSFGRALKGINKNELRMRSLGYNVWIYLYVAYLFSGLFAGLSGVLFAYYNYFVAPINFHLFTSAEVMLMAILGGAGTLFGPLLGAGVIIFLKDITSSYTDRWGMIMGILYILVIVFVPNGIYSAVKEFYKRNVSLKNFIRGPKG